MLILRVGQELKSDVSREMSIFSQIDDAHGAFTKLFYDPIM